MLATETMEGEKALQLANEMCWNTQLKVTCLNLSIPPDKLSLLDAPTVTAYGRNVLKDVLDSLALSEEALDFVHVEHFPSSGYVLPCI